MSKPIEPKFPKRGFNAHFGRDIVAPDGWYLLPAGTDLVDRDRLWTLGGWGQPELFPHSVVVPDRYAWTYARKLPDGQVNDDLPGQGAPEAEPLPQVDPRTQALAEEQRRVAQLRDALRAVYENCRQNRNKGIGAGPLAKARTALAAAGVDLKAPLQWEGTPEAEPQFAPSDPRTLREPSEGEKLLDEIKAAIGQSRSADDWEARIQAELARAKRKFPNWPTDPVHAAAIVSEEAGELTRAVNEACYEPHKTDPARPLDAVITEAIQLGAMVRRFLESAGHYVVAPGPQHDQSN